MAATLCSVTKRARWMARMGAVLAMASVWLPRIAVPVASTGCSCAERGSPVVFDAATVERDPKIVVDGPACNAKSVECMHRDAKDRCDTLWIVPTAEGQCIFAVHFPDGTRIEHVIEYDLDEDYPCRGNIRPRYDDNITRITSAPKPAL